jgi:hypothetical protein
VQKHRIRPAKPAESVDFIQADDITHAMNLLHSSQALLAQASSRQAAQTSVFQVEPAAGDLADTLIKGVRA